MFLKKLRVIISTSTIGDNLYMLKNKKMDKIYFKFISLIGFLFMLLSYFVITLQVYYGLINAISNIFLNTVLIISGALINITIIKLLKLDKKLLENMNILKIYLVVVVIFVNIAYWLIQNVFDYFKVINYSVSTNMHQVCTTEYYLQTNLNN